MTMSRMWTAVGFMVALPLSIKSTIQLSRLVMINSESMGIEEEPGSDMRVSKDPDLEVKERCELSDAFVVTAGMSVSTSGKPNGGFSGLSLRLKVNFGFVPVEVWLVCSFSKVRSHDFSCLNAEQCQRSRRRHRVKLIPFRIVAGRKGEGMGMHLQAVSSEGPIGLTTRRRESWLPMRGER